MFSVSSIAVALLLSAGLVDITRASSPLGLLWTNWDGQQQSAPQTYVMPSSEDAIVAFVRSSARGNQTMKVIGAGLSFSGVQLNQEHGGMMSLDNYDKVLSVKKVSDSKHLVEVQAGISIRKLCEELAAKSLTLINMGATATQSIAGATATGTHGTGMALGNLASQIHSLRVVDASGEVHYADEHTNKKLFDAARVGIGAVGIISTMTLTAVPLWKMHNYQVYYELDSLLAQHDNLVATYPRMQWSFTPYTNDAVVVIREDVPNDTPIYPAEPDGGCWSVTQQTSDYQTRGTSVGCTDWSYKTLTDSYVHYQNRTLYTEMEMMIPVEQAVAAVRDYIEFMDGVKDKHNSDSYVSVMLRYVAKDDMLLSPMSGRDTAVISIIVMGDNEEFTMYASGLQTLCQEKYQGRPHWGKVNYVDGSTVEYLEKVYPGYQDFKEVMSRMDPKGVFSNEYISARIA